MFSRFDPLVGFRCPRCQASLRFRRVLELPASSGSPNFLCACPECQGSIILREHLAFPENWRWVLWLNPMAPLIGGYQSVLLTGSWPDTSTWVVTLVWILLVAALLAKVIKHSRDQLVDWL